MKHNVCNTSSTVTNSISSLQVKGEIDISNIREIRPPATGETLFEVRTIRGKDFRLRADNNADAIQWAKEIHAVRVAPSPHLKLQMQVQQAEAAGTIKEEVRCWVMGFGCSCRARRPATVAHVAAAHGGGGEQPRCLYRPCIGKARGCSLRCSLVGAVAERQSTPSPSRRHVGASVGRQPGAAEGMRHCVRLPLSCLLHVCS